MNASEPRPGVQALRRGRVSLPNGMYHVPTVTRERLRIFLDDRAARAACRSLWDVSLQANFKLMAWVLMPDHFHCLIQLGAEGDVSQSIRHIKTAMSRAANVALEREGAVWVHGFHDHALRSDEDVLTVARYIIANPLRAGLVGNVGDYSYWDAVWL